MPKTKTIIIENTNGKPIKFVGDKKTLWNSPYHAGRERIIANTQGQIMRDANDNPIFCQDLNLENGICRQFGLCVIAGMTLTKLKECKENTSPACERLA